MSWPAAEPFDHPVRLAIMRELELTEDALSPVELSRRLEEKLGTVSHHMQVLKRMKAVKVTRRRKRRGATEHFYRPTGKVKTGSSPEVALERIAELIPPTMAKAAEGQGVFGAIATILEEAGYPPTG